MYCIREIKVFKYKTRKPSLIKSETARKYLYEEKSMRKSSNGADDRTARHLKRMRKATQDQLDQKCEEVPKDKLLSTLEIFTLFQKLSSSVEIRTHADMKVITNIFKRIQDLGVKEFEEFPRRQYFQYFLRPEEFPPSNRYSRREIFTSIVEIESSDTTKTPTDLEDLMDDLMLLLDLADNGRERGKAREL